MTDQEIRINKELLKEISNFKKTSKYIEKPSNDLSFYSPTKIES